MLNAISERGKYSRFVSLHCGMKIDTAIIIHAELNNSNYSQNIVGISKISC